MADARTVSTVIPNLAVVRGDHDLTVQNRERLLTRAVRGEGSLASARPLNIVGARFQRRQGALMVRALRSAGRHSFIVLTSWWLSACGDGCTQATHRLVDPSTA